MVDPAVKGLDRGGDRVDIQWVALPVIAGPVMAVQVGRTTPGVRVQVKLGQAGKADQAGQAGQADRAGKVVSPVTRAGIQNGKWSVPNRC